MAGGSLADVALDLVPQVVPELRCQLLVQDPDDLSYTDKTQAHLYSHVLTNKNGCRLQSPQLYLYGHIDIHYLSSAVNTYRLLLPRKSLHQR